ncbi:GmrSD restriction endonuclease domain-containing protein [Pararhizobium sp. DWP3-4]|uniref:GmrSD restriction endonuclease domain-containing protein n=1 Tax=Pararhizobium sp. DWP3-4 TaxID=2804565 RepID=UPI003CF2FEB3
MEYQSYSVRKLLDSVKGGGIRIPAFQRGFVWDMDHVAYLMDSIYKNYPFGSLLFWRTKNKLNVERSLGRFDLPEPEEDYPVDYVLDGQQRLTSIFTVFQTDLKPKQDDKWIDIYFDLYSEGHAQESQFYPLKENEVDPGKYFPLSALFDSVKYREATSSLTNEQITQVDRLQEKFKEVSIPVQVLKTEDRSMVAIVFERVNRLGVELDTLQLLSAWTWNENFDLLDSFKNLKEELEDFGFEGVGEDSDLILRCTAAILKEEPSAETLLELTGQVVREEFPRVRNGIKGAIDFLRTQLRVYNLKNLPYPALLIPLSVFFAEPNGKEVSYNAETYDKLKRWFWKSCLGNRYSSQTRKTAIRDIKEINALKNGFLSNIDSMEIVIDGNFFLRNVFRTTTANTKTFVLLLSSKFPKSLISGKDIDLEPVLQAYNRSEFHHIYPKAAFKEISEEKINCLANFCFLSAAENKKVGKKKPSVYIDEVGTIENKLAILATIFCETSDFNDDFDSFVNRRNQKIVKHALSLIE